MRWSRRRHNRDRVLRELEDSAQNRLAAARHEASVTARQAPQVARVVAEAGALSAHNHFIDHIKRTLQPRRHGEPA